MALYQISTMLEVLALIPLLFLLMPRLLSNYKVESRFKQLGEYWAVDKMLKILQFFGMGMASKLQTVLHSAHTSFQASRQLALLSEFQKLTIFVRLVRKVIRFVRGPPIFERIFKIKWTVPSTNLELIKMVQTISKTVADVFLAFFFLTDHLTFFYLIGALSEEERTETYLFWGKTMLMGFHIFNFVRLGCLFSRKSFQKSKVTHKELRVAQCDLIAHLLDFTRINPLWKHAIGVEFIPIMAVGSSLARLTRIRYK